MLQQFSRVGWKEQEIKEHLYFHAAHVGYLVIIVSNEDAKNQMPGIERWLDA